MMRCLKFGLCTFLSGALLTLSAQAAPDISVNFTRDTGVAPFDSNDAPGNDSGLNNAIIRTNDIISYKFEVRVLDEDATNVVLRLTTGPGLELDLPAFCRETGVTPPSTVSGDPIAGYSILCNVGDISQGSQVLYALPASVIPEQPHGSQVSLLSASVESDQTAAESFPAASDTVSAAPMLDLIKNDHTRLIGRRAGPSGEDGVVYGFPIEVATRNSGRGNELVTAPISFTDDLSGVSPNARLYQGWAGAYADACVPNNTSGRPRLWNNPNGNTQVADGGPGGDGAGPAERSVWTSGDINCTVPSAGGTTTVTITGADLTGRHYPTQESDGGSLPADTRYLVSGVMYVWIPIADIQAAGGQIAVTNIYSDLNATSISGQSNTEPNIANNTRSFIARDGGSGRWFYNHVDHNNYGVLPSQTSRRSGDGYVLPEQVFATRHYQNNGAWLTKTTLDNIIFCTSFDNSTQRITEITAGQGAKMRFEGTAEGGQPPFTIQYGTGSFGPTQTCENTDSDTGWHNSLALVPGGASAVTKVRAFADYLAAPGGNSTNYRANLIVRYTALDNTPGTIVSEYGTFKNDQQNNGNWILSTFNDTTALGNYGDRLFLTKVAVRINKDTVPSGEDQVLAGDALTFILSPSATTPVDPPNLTTDITITDTLPEWYEYQVGSGTPPPSDFTVNPDGTTTLVWEVPNMLINQPMDTISYDVTVKPTTPDQTSAVNTVVISSPNDGSPEAVRTDTHSVLTLNPAGFSVFKSSVPVLTRPDGSFTYELTYANTGTSDLGTITIIDVLPHPAIPVYPSTDYDGVSNFNSVSGAVGETFEYTSDDPLTVQEDPNHADNQPGGATRWCVLADFGIDPDCPVTVADVTAFRATSPPFNQGDATRQITVTMDGSGNTAYDLYSNRFTAQADGLAFPLTSNVATTRVRTADISLLKSVDTPNAVGGEVVTFALTLRNAGPHAAQNVTVEDQLPSGYRYVLHGGAGTYDPGSGLWTIGAVPVNGTRTLNITAEVLPTGDYLNIAEVTGQDYADPDSTPGNRATIPNEDDTAQASVAGGVGAGQNIPPQACQSSPVVLDWSTLANPGGNPAFAYTIDGYDVSFAVETGGDGRFENETPAIATIHEGGLGAGTSGLRLTTRETDGRLRVSIDLGIGGTGVEQLRLALFHLDGSERIDRVMGYFGGLQVPPLLQGASMVSIGRNGANGTYVSLPETSGDGTLEIGFASPVDRLVLDITDDDPLSQQDTDITLHNISWCDPVVDYSFRWSPDHSSTATPGGAVIYNHSLDIGAGYDGSALSFHQTSDQGLFWQVFQDNGDGVFNSGDILWTDGGTIGAGDGQAFWVKTVLPTNITGDWQDISRFTAAVLTTDGSHSASQTVTDVTRSTGANSAGEIRGEKFIALDMGCDGIPETSFAKDQASIPPGHCAVYRITYVNVGVAGVSEVKVEDHTPNWTVYEDGSAAYTQTPSGLTPDGLIVPAANTAGAVVFRFSGTLAPGESGAVQFSVRVQ